MHHDAPRPEIDVVGAQQPDLARAQPMAVSASPGRSPPTRELVDTIYDAAVSGAPNRPRPLLDLQRINVIGGVSL